MIPRASRIQQLRTRVAHLERRVAALEGAAALAVLVLVTLADAAKQQQPAANPES